MLRDYAPRKRHQLAQLLALIIIGAMASLPLALRAEAEPLHRSVLIIDELGPGGVFNTSIASAIRVSMARAAGEPISVYTEYLNLRRFKGAQYEEFLRSTLQQKYRETQFAVIVVLGLRGLRLVLNWRPTLWPGVPVVFTLVNADGLAGLTLPPDVTGRTFRTNMQDAVTAARAVVPRLDQLALIGDPAPIVVSTSDARQRLDTVAPEIDLLDFSGLPMAEIKSRASVLPPNAAILYTSLFVDGAGVSYTPVDALRQILAVANRPVLVQFETLLGFGAVGGFVVLPVIMGEEAAGLALRIVNGESASSMPILPEESIKPVFDWRELKRWSVDVSLLPPQSLIRFRQLTPWEQYRWQIVLIITVILLQAALILGLLYEHRRRREAETSVRSSLAQLAHMDRLATAGELSASIAHEISQPLAGMVAHANAGLRWLGGITPNLDEARATFKAIAAAGHHAGEVIQHIRALFKKGVPQNELVNINDLIREILAILDTELRQRKVTVETALAEALPPVRGDRVQLQQVIMNLIVNAAEAMQAIAERKRFLRIVSEPAQNATLVVTVEDSGPGIDPADLERVFKPFYTTKSKGMGLGLSISRSIVEAHHGRLTASVRTPLGTVFRLVLPFAQQS